MGNHASKENISTARKIKNTMTSPLSPLKKRRNQKKNMASKPERSAQTINFDWLSCYNSTPSDLNPYDLPMKYSFDDFILHYHQELGEGAFAKVVMATHIPSRQKVAVKVITKSAIPEEMREYVVKEPGVLAKMQHNRIVSLLHVHEDTNYIYMFLQFMSGGDLHSRLERDGTISEVVVKSWFKQIVEALAYTHSQNFCHRDLKLENLLISGEGTKADILMIDYGFAGYIPNEEHLFEDFPGSFCYAAPELIKGTPYKGRSADIYSLGVILYTLLQSAYPFYSDNKREMTKMILHANVEFDGFLSDNARELITWMLMKNPNQRPTIEQVTNHPWLRPTVKAPMSPISPLQKTAHRIKQTARASLSPVPKRRRRKGASIA